MLPWGLQDQLSDKERELRSNANQAAQQATLERLAGVEGGIFAAQEFIRSKEGEADTVPVMTNMLDKAAEINRVLVQQLQQ